MKPRIATLESHLGYWLRMVSNQVSKSFAQKVEGEGVTVAEWVILRSLYEEKDVQAIQISKSTNLTKGAISKLISRLERKKLVSRANSEFDGRSEKLNLTVKGRSLVPRLVLLADSNDKEFFEHLSARESKELLGLLKKVVESKNIRHTPID